MEWIKVEDRLPEYGELVFVTNKSEYAVVRRDLFLEKEIWSYEDSDTSAFSNIYPESNMEQCYTHWMKPEPPKETTK